MSSALTYLAKNALTECAAEQTFASRNKLAAKDMREGVHLLPLAWTLGSLDIRLRYRGSVLGPFWLTLSTGVMVAALGYLYAGIFHTDIHDYLPFLALSMVLWAFLSTAVSDACQAFTEAEGVIRAVRMPFSLFATRILVRNALVLAHNLLVILVVDAVFQLWPGWHLLLAIPGLVLWCVDTLSVILLLGGFCARFRDFPPIVGSVMQIAFFVTPVLWKPEQLGTGVKLLPLNPFFDLMEIVRGPLLGGMASANVWIGAALYSAGLVVLSWFFFTRTRGRIAFWL
jgi:lipopolysaccharide transport system permease protein